MPLPPSPYEYMERRMAKVSSDYHVRFDNAYYSVDRTYLHKKKASSSANGREPPAGASGLPIQAISRRITGKSQNGTERISLVGP